MIGSEPTTDVHRFRAFGGAACEVLTVGATADEVSMAVAEVYAFEARLTRFDAASELSRLNASSGRRFPVSPLLESLLRAAVEAHGLTEGLVDAAVLPALVAAGYNESIEAVRRRDGDHDSRGVVPASTPFAGRCGPLPEVLEVGDGWACLAPGAAVDLGGVGKGWLADRLAERFDNAVVNLGGDLRVVGSGPDGSGWAVGLCDGATANVVDGGVATSGIGGRRWAGGHHLIDPRTARPARTEVIAVSVVAATALTAEVLAKGAVIVGALSARGWCHARGALHVAMEPPSNHAGDAA